MALLFNYTRQNIRQVLAICMICLSFTSYGQEKDSIILYDFSLDELMNLRIETAAKHTQTISDIPASIVIITRQDIESQGWQTIEEVLSNVPGLHMLNDYLWFGSDNYGVRGFYSTGSFNTMIVMVNGITQKEDWYNSFPLTKVNVPVEAIDRIEVIRGPMSVVYGNNAFLGAINIVTNQSLNSRTGIVGIGSNGNYKAFGRISGEYEKLKFSVNIGTYGSNGINQPYSKMTNLIEDSWDLPNNPSSKGQLTDHRKYIDSWFNYEYFYFGFSQTHTNRGVIDYYPGYKNGHIAEIESANSFFGYKREVGSNVDINAEVGYYSFRNRLDYNHNSDTTAYGFNDIFSNAFDMELNLNINITESWFVSFGAYYQKILRNKLVVDAPNLSNDYVNLDAGLSRLDNKFTWATFVQSSYALSRRVSLHAGARIEQTPSYYISYSVRFDPSETYEYLSRKGKYQYGDPYIIPRIAVLYHLNEGHHLKLMYGRAIKQASIGENMDIVRYPDRDHLKPAHIQTLEANYYGLFSQKTIINFSIFQNYAKNLISRTNQLEDGVMRLFNTNSGELFTLGSEITAQYKPTSRFNSTLSIAVQESRNLQKGYENIKLEYAPQFLAYTTIAYQIARNVTVGLSGYYIGSMETYWRPDSQNQDDPLDNRTPTQLIADGSRIGQKAPGYFVFNTNVRINNVFSKRIFCSLYVHNILNSEVRYPTTRSNDIFEKGTLGYGRYISFNLGFNFNNN
jgi:outer membrane receptor for ferrienterochelin and colicins